ncbi:hypothetical protein Q1695_012277 [Nippostrongylus brasiliensis]|nr:hypothetical protein Q1695_012277 [Nippostrongylus brasiliensis]
MITAIHMDKSNESCNNNNGFPCDTPASSSFKSTQLEASALAKGLPSLSREHFRPLFRFSTPWYSSCDSPTSTAGNEAVIRNDDVILEQEKEKESRLEMPSKVLFEGSNQRSPVEKTPLLEELPPEPIGRARAGSDEGCIAATSSSIEETTFSGDTNSGMDSVDSQSSGCTSESSSISEHDKISAPIVSKSVPLCTSPCPTGAYDAILAVLDYTHAEVAILKHEYQQLLDYLKRKLESH